MSNTKTKREINFLHLTGTVTKIGELIHIQRDAAPDLYKRVLTVEMIDGQRLFPEIRNMRLKQLEKNQIQEGCLVNIEYSFEGSEKNGKRYNNIYINKIEKL